MNNFIEVTNNHGTKILQNVNEIDFVVNNFIYLIHIGDDVDSCKCIECKETYEELKAKIMGDKDKCGKWIENEDLCGDSFYKCSVCGEEYVQVAGIPIEEICNHCPNCGAKMDK